MQIEAIEAFVMACKLGSFQATAEHLNISQPAVSKRLAGLEERLGQRLFDRVGRRLTLTQAGLSWLPHATEVLNILDDGRRALDNLKETVSGQLNMGLSHHVALHRMPDALQDFAKQYSDVELAISFTDSEAACKDVMRGDSEIAIVTLPDPAHPTLVQTPVWEDPMKIYAAKDHPLAQAKQVDISELANYAGLLPPESSTTFSLINQTLRNNGVKPVVKMTSPYLETLRMLASVEQGWVVLPETMPDDDGLVEINFGKQLNIKRQLGIVRHPKRSLSNAARAMCRLLLGREIDAIEP